MGIVTFFGSGETIPQAQRCGFHTGKSQERPPLEGSSNMGGHQQHTPVTSLHPLAGILLYPRSFISNVLLLKFKSHRISHQPSHWLPCSFHHCSTSPSSNSLLTYLLWPCLVLIPWCSYYRLWLTGNIYPRLSSLLSLEDFLHPLQLLPPCRWHHKINNIPLNSRTTLNHTKALSRWRPFDWVYIRLKVYSCISHNFSLETHLRILVASSGSPWIRSTIVSNSSHTELGVLLVLYLIPNSRNTAFFTVPREVLCPTSHTARL